MLNCSWTSERVGLKLQIFPEVEPQVRKVFRERNQVKLHSAHYDVVSGTTALPLHIVFMYCVIMLKCLLSIMKLFYISYAVSTTVKLIMRSPT